MESYELVVIGGGATGLGAARGAARAGRRVAIVEAERLGGDCTHFGCVPSKTLLDLAHRVAGVRAGREWGLPEVGAVDFARVMERVQQVVAQVEQDETAEVLAGEGIDVLRGWARFTGSRTISVGGRSVTAGKFVLALGSTASVPPIPGLDGVAVLDNRTVFDLREQPEHLLVLGGGPIGVELAQAFAGLGSRVALVEALPRILAKEEPEASEAITRVLRRGGVDVRAGAAVERVGAGPTLHLAGGATVSGSHLLVAVGRRPATAGLDLEAAGIETGRAGEVVTDEKLRTTNPDVFAAGDCTSRLQFTHVGDEQGRLAAGNAFACPARMTRFDASGVPWVTFTDPEVGRVGMSEQQAYDEFGDRARVAVVTLAELDRPRTSGHVDGFVKLVVGPRPVARHPLLDRVLGLTAVSPAGGELAASAAVAMRTGMIAARYAQAVAPYPTHSMALRVVAARLLPNNRDSWRPARPHAERGVEGQGTGA